MYLCTVWSQRKTYTYSNVLFVAFVITAKCEIYLSYSGHDIKPTSDDSKYKVLL